MTNAGGGLTIGDAVRVRSRDWTVRHMARWTDCVTIDLAARTHRGDRSFILPFDRPQGRANNLSRRTVGARRALHRLRSIGASTHPFGGLRTLAAAPVRLLPYQLAPALAVLRHGETRILLADAVGLGKTIQAGIVIRELQAILPALRGLVLVPAGLRRQWAEELQTHFELQPAHASSAWLRDVTRERPADVNPWGLPGLYIASHDFVKRPEVLRPLQDVRWDVLVVDEAHAATPGSDRGHAIDTIARRSTRVLLLTATPHAGDLAAFDQLCRIGRLHDTDPCVLMFQRTRDDVGESVARRIRFFRVEPTDAERRMHRLVQDYAQAIWREAAGRGDARAQLVASILRKRGLSSAAALAASVARRLALLTTPIVAESTQLLLPLDDEDPLADEDDGRVLATPGLADSRRERRWMSAILEATRTAAARESKLHRLRALVRRTREPLIVFTEYRDTLAKVEAALQDAGREIVLLHGGLDPSERADVQRRFNQGGAILLATDAASEGLNLHHHCRAVVHYELPWSPSRLQQRAGRVDRLGQTRRVHEIALVSATEAERLVLAPLAARLAKAAQVTHGSAALLAAFGESDVARTILAGGPAEITGRPQLEAAVRSIDLTAETAIECQRLADHRRWLATSGADDRCRAFRTLKRGTGQNYVASLVIVFRLEHGGQPVHEEVRILRCRMHATAGARRQRLLLHADALWDNDTGVALAVHDLLEEVRARVGPIYAAATRAVRTRELAIAGEASPLQRDLVQIGLFDRRAERSLEARRARSATVTGVGAADDEPLEAVAALRGVFVTACTGAAA